MLCSIDSCIRLWKTPESNPILTLNYPLNNIKDAVFSSDGKALFVVGDSNIIYISNLYTGDVKTLETDVRCINAIALSRDGTKFVIGSAAGNIRVYSVADLALIGGHNAHRSPITSVAFIPSGKGVIAGDMKGKVSYAEYSKASMLRNWTSEFGPVHCIADPKSINKLAIASGTKLRIYDFDHMKVAAAIECGKATAVKFSPTNPALIAVSSGNEVLFLDSNKAIQMSSETYSSVVTGFDWISIDAGSDLCMSISLDNGELFTLRAKQLEHHMMLSDDPADKFVKLIWQPVEVSGTPKFFPIPNAAAPEPAAAPKSPPKKEVKPILKTKQTAVKTQKETPNDKKVRLQLKTETTTVVSSPHVGIPDEPELVRSANKAVRNQDHPEKPAPAPAPTPAPAPQPEKEKETEPEPAPKPKPKPREVVASPTQQKWVSTAPKILTESSESSFLDSEVDLTKLSPTNREMVKIILSSITDTTERIKEEFNTRINTVHLDLLCRIRQLSDTVEELKKQKKV